MRRMLTACNKDSRRREKNCSGERANFVCRVWLTYGIKSDMVLFLPRCPHGFAAAGRGLNEVTVGFVCVCSFSSHGVGCEGCNGLRRMG